MAKLDNEDYDGIAKALRKSGGGNSSPSSGSSSGGSLTSMIPDNMFGGASNVIKKFVANTEETMNDWRSANSNFGISMNNDAYGLKAGVIKTRMSFEEFSESVEAGRIGFTSIGGTMTESAKIFMKVSTSLSDYDGDKLKMMGIQQGEYNKLLAITMSSSRHLNLEKAEDQEIARRSVLAMATEMDKTAKLTGLSRKEQESIIEKNREDQAFQSRIRNLQKKGIDTSQITTAAEVATTSGTGDLFKQMIQGGKLSEESNTLLQLMGGDLSTRYRQTVEAMKSSNPAIAKKAAEDFGKINSEAQSAFLSDANNEYSASITNKQTEVLQKAQNASEKYGGAGIVANMDKTGKTAAESYMDAAAVATREQQGLDTEGKKVTGATTTEALIKVESTLTDFRKKQGELVEAGNIGMAKQLELTGAMNKLRTLREPDKEGKPFADTLGGFGPVVDKFSKDLIDNKAIDNLPTRIGELFKTGLSGVTSLVTNATEIVLNGAGVPISQGSNQVIQPPGGKHSEGTKESFGNWFGKDFGSGMLAELHGKEAVVPQGKITEFITDMQQQIMGDMKNPIDIVSQMREQFNSVAKLQSADFEKPVLPNQSFQPPAQPKPEEKSPMVSGDITLKDLNEQLIKLNTVMVKLVTNTSEMVETSSKQYRATKQLSPNLNAR